MKTIVYFLAVIVSSFFVVKNASAQYGPPPPPDAYHRHYNDRYQNARMQAFYYYPQSNVYYNAVSDRYIFFSRNAWVVSDRLPRYYNIRREPSFVVYHNGFDVWNDNRQHCAKYRDIKRNAPDVAYNRGNSYDNYNRPDKNYREPDRKDDWRR